MECDLNAAEMPRRKFCFWCVVKPLETKMIGFRLFSVECHHSNGQHFSQYSLSKSLVAIQLAILVALVYFAYRIFSKIMASGTVFNLITRLRFCLLIISIVCFLVLVAVSLKYKTHINFIELINFVVEMINECGTTVYTESDVSRLRKGYYKLGYLLLVTIISAIAIVNVDVFITGGQTFIELTSLGFAFLVLISGVLMSFGVTWTLKRIYFQEVRDLQDTLNCIIENESKLPRDNFKFLHEKLRSFMKTYNQFATVVDQTVSFMTVPAIAGFVCVTMYLIIIYSLLGEWLISSNLSELEVIIVYSFNIIGLGAVVGLFGVIIFANTITDPVSLNNFNFHLILKFVFVGRSVTIIFISVSHYQIETTRKEPSE